jgi:hypothetical protein
MAQSGFCFLVLLARFTQIFFMRYLILLLAGLFTAPSIFSQNVGIGTSSPLYKLTVQTPSQSYGMVHTNGNIRIGTYTGSSVLAGEGAWLGTLSNHPLYLFTVGSDPQVTVTQNGYVGINTMAPFGPLDVRRIPGNIGTAFFGGTTYGSVFNFSTTQDTYIRGGLAGSRVIINDAALGNVGIGTDSPADKLTVSTATSNYGVTHTDGVITTGTWVGGGAGWFGTKSNHPLNFFTNNGGPQLSILTNGMVVVGNQGVEFPNPLFSNWNVRTGTANANFYFSYANVTKAGISSTDGSYFQISDARLKKNILPYKSVLNGVKKMNVLTYEYITDVSGQRCFGLIAQNAAEHFPEIVSEIADKDGKKLLAIVYGKTGVLALKAIQEQQVIIESQQDKIQELEKRITALEKLIKEKL